MLQDKLERSDKLRVHCTGLENGGTFPLEFTGRGKNISPEFVLENLSPDAKTVAVTLKDISHPLFKRFTHWVIWNIPASNCIPGAIPHGKRVETPVRAVQGVAYGWHRYAGPKPPKGTQHQYCFTVYTLDCELSLGAGASMRKFLKSAANHILQQGTVIGAFE